MVVEIKTQAWGVKNKLTRLDSLSQIIYNIDIIQVGGIIND